jgi:hypothetical protein
MQRGWLHIPYFRQDSDIEKGLQYLTNHMELFPGTQYLINEMKCDMVVIYMWNCV